MLRGISDVIVPTIVIYEVYKKLLMESGKSAADAFASDAMRRNTWCRSTMSWRSAPRRSVSIHRLPMADAIIYASSMAQNAELVTGDPHFGGLPGVIIP